MIKLTRVLLVFGLLTSSLSAGGEGWLRNFAEAKKKAQQEGKDLLVDFSGSDWCGWCIKLEKEVFSQAVFKEYAAKHFVLVSLDFPRKVELPQEEKKQNDALRDLFQVSGFPTVVLCDQQGRPYARTGYQRNGAEAYVKHLGQLQEKKQHRDAAFEEAKSLEGTDKARALEKALSSVPRKHLKSYQKELDAIAKADPKDASGFMARWKVEEVSAGLRTLVNPLFRDRKLDQALVVVDDYVQKHQLEGEAKQTAMLYKLQVLYIQKKYEQAGKLADEIIAINDANRPARYARMIKTRVNRVKEKK